MAVETVALFALTELLLSLTPGPAVLLVVGLSVRHGFRTGMMATVGIIATNALYFTLSAIGVGALILASATLFTALKWVGAAYLIWLGIGMARPLLRRLLHSASGNAETLDLGRAKLEARERQSDLRTFWRGFSLQASNPKTLAFFVAILPQFVTPDASLGLQMVILGVISVLLEVPILVIYAFAAAFSARVMRERLVEWIEAVGGAILIALGAALAVSRRAD